MMNKSLKLSLIASIILSTSLYSADEFTDEFADDFGGDEEIKIVKKEPKKPYSIYGNIKIATSYNTTKNKSISSFKLSTNTHFDYDINNNIKFKSILNAYKDNSSGIKDDYNVDLNEAYFQAKLSSKFDLTVGRKIIVWGKSDNIRITDTINPMDYTTPGMTDIKDLRLGRIMSKLDYSTSNDWDISTIILHENRYSTMSISGSEYYIPMQLPKEPNDNTKNTGIAFSASASLKGADISFYALNDYVDNKDYKTNMLGFAYNIVNGSFLYKTEFAYFDNYNSDVVDSKADAMAGLEYTGFNDTTLSLEVANKNDEIQYALRATQSYINQTLDLTVLYNGYGKTLDGGGFVRLWADYDIDDKFKTSFGFIDYIGGYKQNFEMIKDNDRIFASLAYNF